VLLYVGPFQKMKLQIKRNDATSSWPAVVSLLHLSLHTMWRLQVTFVIVEMVPTIRTLWPHSECPVEFLMCVCIHARTHTHTPHTLTCRERERNTHTRSVWTKSFQLEINWAEQATRKSGNCRDSFHHAYHQDLGSFVKYLEFTLKKNMNSEDALTWKN